MRKSIVALMLALFCAPLLAEDNGGFKQEGQAPAPEDQTAGYRAVTDLQDTTAINQLADLPDGAPVSLLGNILRQTGDQHYLLRDKTGTVHLQINNSVWQGQEVKPDELVAVRGRLVKAQGKLSVRVNKLNQM
ncbi:YgiW/YdeI family stress tolerance OB fold protein [[Erwinia] mediterraneensis]|uniref:YgiW/YdeI family stress tolerance OB fold protein n=1 Tax=[Erwinia] mediterraneensis TaxID=2161819 RepID=UPI0013EEF0CB|nr:NirD/YgiW/YdeI family stress tolerance protein [[Erwinia] mediterraneensis]